MLSFGGIIDQNDLAFVSQRKVVSRLAFAFPAPKVCGRPRFNVTTFVERDRRMCHTLVHVKPVYYEAWDHSMRPISEIALHHGNHSFLFPEWARGIMHPRWLRWLMRRQGLFGSSGTVRFLPDGLPEKEYALVEAACAFRGRRYTDSTFYPDADPETTTVDGRAIRHGVSEAFATIRSGNGTLAQDSNGNTAQGYIDSNSGSVAELDRAFFLFDTSSIPDTDSISAATFSTKVIAKVDQFPEATSIRLVLSTVASNTAIAASDYQGTVGNTTAQATDKTVSSITTGAYNDWTLDATGLGNISKTGVTKFGLKVVFDADNSSPTLNGSESGISDGNYADTAGTTSDPKLLVTHASAAVTSGNLLLVGVG